VLEGRLGDFTLPDILRLLAFTAKSGRLWVEHDGTRARIEVLEGRVRDATVDAARLGLARRLLGLDLIDAESVEEAVADADELPSDLDLARRLIETEAVAPEQLADLVREQALDAVFELLRWQEGAFSFEAGPPTSRGPSTLDLAVSVDELLDEASRRLDAHEAVRARTGPGTAVVSIRRPGRERAEVALTPEGWTLLALVDGRRTVDDIVTLCGQGDYRTRRTLTGLLDEGVIAIGDAESAAPGERLEAASETIRAIEDRLAPTSGSAAATLDPRGRPTLDAPMPPSGPDAETSAGPADDRAAEALPATAPTAPAADAPPATPAAETPPATAAVETPPASPAEPAVPEPGPSSSWVRELEDQRTSPPATAGPDGADADPKPWRSPAGDRGQLEVDDVELAAGDTDEQRVTPLRAKVRTDRLRTDPDVDEDLVRRLIDGVEGL
jgi:hypothetical protein